MLRALIAVAFSLVTASDGLQDRSALATAVSGVVVDAVTNAPIVAAVVELSPYSMEGLDKNASRRLQLTDTKGRFAFTDVPEAAALSIRARKTGYLDGTYMSDPGGSVSQFGVRQGQWVSDVRVPLWRPGAISGTVSDEASRPVVDVWVRLLTKVRILGRDRLVPRGLTRTDDRGQYRFGGLALGQYVVQVPSVQASAASRESQDSLLVVPHFPVPPPVVNGRSFIYPPVYSPVPRGSDQATGIELTYGEQRGGVDLALAPVAAHRVSGVLVGPPESWAGVPLRLVPQGAEGLGPGDIAATTFANTDGRFTFLNVAEGTYSLEVSRGFGQLKFTDVDAVGFREMEFSRSIGSANLGTIEWDLDGVTGLVFASTAVNSASSAYWARQAVIVGDGDSQVTVSMRPTASLRGRIVKNVTPSARVPDIDPVLGLRLDPAEASSTLDAPRAEREPGDGEGFTIRGLTPGKYSLRTQNGWIIKSITWQGRDYTDVPFDAAETPDFNGVQVVVTNAGATVSGTALDPRGAPGVRVRVMIFPAAALGTVFGFWPPRVRSVIAGKDGRFEIAQLPAGDYAIIAVDDPSATVVADPEFFTRAHALVTPLTLTWGTPTSLNLVIRPQVR